MRRKNKYSTRQMARCCGVLDGCGTTIMTPRLWMCNLSFYAINCKCKNIQEKCGRHFNQTRRVLKINEMKTLGTFKCLHALILYVTCNNFNLTLNRKVLTVGIVCIVLHYASFANRAHRFHCSTFIYDLKMNDNTPGDPINSSEKKPNLHTSAVEGNFYF